MNVEFLFEPDAPPIWPDDEFTAAWLEGIQEARRRADIEEASRDLTRGTGSSSIGTVFEEID